MAPSRPGPRGRSSARAPDSPQPPRPALTYLAGSRGNLKKARSDCVLFRVQFGAAQKFGMVVRAPAGPALPSPPRQGSSTAAPRGRGGELGRPAGRLRQAARAEEGLAGEAARARRGARAEAGLGPRLHSAVSGREDLPPPPPLLHLQPARDAAASFPQCTLALGGALSPLSLLLLSSPATFPAGERAHTSRALPTGRGLEAAEPGASASVRTRTAQPARWRHCACGLASRDAGASRSQGFSGRFVVLQVPGASSDITSTAAALRRPLHGCHRLLGPQNPHDFGDCFANSVHGLDANVGVVEALIFPSVASRLLL